MTWTFLRRLLSPRDARIAPSESSKKTAQASKQDRYIFPALADRKHQPRFLRVSTLRTWSQLKPCQSISPELFVLSGERNVFDIIRFSGYGDPDYIESSNFFKANAVHFISHRWHAHEHPDPTGSKLRYILDYFPDDALIWMDYLCLPQYPRTAHDEAVFLDGIESIPEIIRCSWFCAIEPIAQMYRRRAWCQFEIMCATRFNSLPKTPGQQGYRRSDIPESMQFLRSNSDLMDAYLECREALPKDKLPPGGEHIGAGFTRRGYYLDVPDLDAPVFSRFKDFFWGLEIAEARDRPLLWSNLKRVFPPRRLDFTSEHP